MPRASMTSRVEKIEQGLGVGQRPIVVVMPYETFDQVFTQRGVSWSDDPQVIHVEFVSPKAA